VTEGAPGGYTWTQFRYCPKCGMEYRRADFRAPSTSFGCARCGYEFFQNSSPASTAVLGSRSRPTEIVLLTRTTAPGEGLLGLPGGFLQYREPPYDGVRREVAEEIGIHAEVDRLLDAYLVDYPFRGAIVSVLELVFLCAPIEVSFNQVQSSEASAVGYYDVRDVLQSPSRLAFPEQQQALRRYRDHIGF
jgi:ADP-ribose pyrophosphatase YjhB (NUDIX family)